MNRAKKSQPARSGAQAKRSRRKTRQQFTCVNDGVPQETTDLLRAACEGRNVEYFEIKGGIAGTQDDASLTEQSKKAPSAREESSKGPRQEQDQKLT